MEKRSLFCSREVQLPEGNDAEPMFIGYASVFYDGTPETEYRIWDDYVERILPGAFDRALREGQDVRCLFNHDSSMVLGRSASKTLRLSVDTIGLRYAAIYNVNDPDHVKVREKLLRKDVSGSSFMFMPTGWNIREEGDLTICEIADVDLFDVGPVTFPAYEGASSGLRACRKSDAEQAREECRRLIATRSEEVKAVHERRSVLLAQKTVLANI